MLWHFLLWPTLAAVWGRRIKDVTCEKCQTLFHYELTRFGTGSAPVIAGAEFAQAEANRHLQQRLEQDEELVPCPACGWVNENLIKAYRRRRFRRLPWLSAVIVPAGSLAALYMGAGLARLIGGPSEVPWIALLAVLLLSLTSPLWIFAVRYALRRRINPNRRGPHETEVPPGTPAALVESADPQTGKGILVPVPRRHLYPEEQAGWAVFLPLRDRLPNVCCVCLVPTDSVYKSPFKVNKRSDFAVPLCAACASRTRRRWWWMAVASGPVVFGSLGFLTMQVPGLDTPGRVFMFILGGFLPTVFALATLPGRASQPFRLRCIDAERGVYKFQAANPAYTRLLTEQVQQSGG